MPTPSIEHIEALLIAADEHFGCWLLDGHELFSASPSDAERSQRNGRGAAAWHDHCLVVPMRDQRGSLNGLIVVEDPIDHLLPTDAKRRALRLLVDQVSALQSGIATRERLQHLASHDPLTGVRNRRNLSQLLDAHDEVALLICDLDDFKRINDIHGHVVGDRVLVRFGQLLRELARQDDVAMRLGGEEFCVVLPRTNRAGALAAAERLRVETATRMHDLVAGGVTVSIGVASTSHGVLDARALLAAADRGLYAAKAAGRNRVLHAAATDLDERADRS